MGGKGSGRKKKSGAPGTEGAAEAWNDAAEKANGGGKSQGRLPINTSDDKVIRTERQILEPLSEAEHAFVSSQVINVQARITELEAEIKAFVTPRQKDIKKLEKESAELVRDARAKARHVLVTCKEVHEFRTRSVKVYRLDVGDPDVGELIETRQMTPEELEEATFAPPEGERLELDDDAPPAEARH